MKLKDMLLYGAGGLVALFIIKPQLVKGWLHQIGVNLPGTTVQAGYAGTITYGMPASTSQNGASPDDIAHSNAGGAIGYEPVINAGVKDNRYNRYGYPISPNDPSRIIGNPEHPVV